MPSTTPTERCCSSRMGPSDALELVTQPDPIPVTRVVGVFEGDLAGHDAGADHGGLEARPFLVGEDGHGHRVARGCLVVVEGADGLEGAEDAELAVVFAPRRHRVGVRAHHDGRQALAARPLAEDVPHAVDGDREPRGAHPLDEEIAAAPVFIGEGEPGEPARRRLPDAPQRRHALFEPLAVDLHLH